jgi:hypothetical protein
MRKKTHKRATKKLRRLTHVFKITGNVLTGADNGSIDHSDSGIMGSGKRAMTRPQILARRQRTNQL